MVGRRGGRGDGSARGAGSCAVLRVQRHARVEGGSVRATASVLVSGGRVPVEVRGSVSCGAVARRRIARLGTVEIAWRGQCMAGVCARRWRFFGAIVVMMVGLGRVGMRVVISRGVAVGRLVSLAVVGWVVALVVAVVVRGMRWVSGGAVVRVLLMSACIWVARVVGAIGMVLCGW